MKKKNESGGSFRLFLFMGLAVFLCSGCDGIKGKLLIMEANMQESRTRHNQAISTYSEALHYPEVSPYAEYGLGVVYLMLGENNAAFQRFDNADEIMNAAPANYNEELNYRIHYNRGVLYFHSGNFGEAASEFRNALEIDAGRIEAKRNLELSLLSLEQQNNSAVESSPVEIKNEQGTDNTLFDYLRQKEVDTWKSQESPEDKTSPWLDY